mgnify:CR=1 FL=1
MKKLMLIPFFVLLFLFSYFANSESIFIYNETDLVDLIPLMAPDADLQQKLLVDNPHRLYGFSN